MTRTPGNNTSLRKKHPRQVCAQAARPSCGITVPLHAIRLTSAIPVSNTGPCCWLSPRDCPFTAEKSARRGRLVG